MADVPLEPMADAGMYHHTVVDLAEYRVQLGRTPRHAKTCLHSNLVYSREERRVWCRDCERTINPFDAFAGIVGRFTDLMADVQFRQRKADEAMAATARQRATKALDSIWASNGQMAPCCPHCRRGLLPEDFAGGASAAVSRELERARRRRETPDAG
jgi:hypothetical protein